MDSEQDFICEVEYTVRERVVIPAADMEQASQIAEDNSQGALEGREIISPRKVKRTYAASA